MMRVLVAVTALMLTLGACGGNDVRSAKDESETASESASPTPAPTKDVAAERAELVAEAERLVLAELPVIPLWEGTTAKGVYVSDAEVCVDRNYRSDGGLDGKGGSAGYVVVTFPDGELGEPQDGECASATPKPKPEAVEVPSDWQSEPGLVTRDDMGDVWPLTVDYGALDCRASVIDGVTLKSVTLRVPNKQYAVNGTAKTHTPFPDIDEIWADDPDVDGLKIGMGPLTERGLALC